MSPRARLRAFFVDRFSIAGSLERFVNEYFKSVTAEIGWQSSLVVQAESLVGVLSDRGLLGQLWPALLAERKEFAEQIRALSVAWSAASAGGTVSPESQNPSSEAVVSRDRLAEIFRAARKAKLDEAREALFVGLPGYLQSSPTQGTRAQLLVDLDRLNRSSEIPRPLGIWLENAQLLLDDDAGGETFARFLSELPPLAQESAGSEPDQDKVTQDLEFAIQAHARPGLLVANGWLQSLAETPWTAALERERQTVRLAIAATGRLESPDGKYSEWQGAGAIVGDDLVCISRHMLEAALDGKSSLPRLLFDPWREAAGPLLDTALPVTEVLLKHPVLDIAFIHVPGLAAAGIKPLTLSASAAEFNDPIFRVTYVGADSRVDPALQSKVFGGRLSGDKWVLPGKVTQVRDLYSAGGTRLSFDSTTLGGTGGPVVSLETGQMVALAVGRMYLYANWGVPSSEILRDPRVRALGVAMSPDAPAPDDPWAEQWASREEVSPEPTE